MLEQVKCTAGVSGDVHETTLNSPAWVLTAGLVQQPKVHHGLQNTILPSAVLLELNYGTTASKSTNYIVPDGAD